MSSKLPPTSQQVDIIQAVRADTRPNLICNAGAGTGKTSTAILISEAMDGTVVYLAYNQAIKAEASKKMPANCVVKTTHGLAYGAMNVGKVWAKKGNWSPAGSRDFRAARINRDRVQLLADAAQAVGSYMSAASVAYNAFVSVGRFQNSADSHITVDHCGSAEYSVKACAAMIRRDDRAFDSVDVSAALEGRLGADAELGDKLVKQARDLNQRIKLAVHRAAKQLWSHMSDPRHPCVITHDTYLKLYQLGLQDGSINPPKCSLLILDEAQDTNPCVISIVKSIQAQKVMLGDRYQSIYAFRGAVNAMESFPDWQTLPLTQSWRYGSQIAALASSIIRANGADYDLQGAPHLDTQIVDVMPKSDHVAVLFRTNAGVIERAIEEIAKGTELRIEIKDVAKMGKLLADAGKISMGEPIDSFMSPEFQIYADWNEIRQNSEGDVELTRIVNIVQKYGGEESIELGDTLASHKNSRNPAVTLSTAHKSKGLEWTHVELFGDFPSPDDPSEKRAAMAMDPQNLNLLYVAVTRAQQFLKPNAAARYFLRGEAEAQNPAQDDSAGAHKIELERDTP